MNPFDTDKPMHIPCPCGADHSSEYDSQFNKALEESKVVKKDKLQAQYKELDVQLETLEKTPFPEPKDSEVKLNLNSHELMRRRWSMIAQLNGIYSVLNPK